MQVSARTDALRRQKQVWDTSRATQTWCSSVCVSALAKVDPSGAYRTGPIENHDRYVRLSYRAGVAIVMVVNDLRPLAM